MADDTTLNFTPPVGGEDVLHEVYRGNRLIGYLVPNAEGIYCYESSRYYVVHGDNYWDSVTLKHLADKLDEVNGYGDGT